MFLVFFLLLLQTSFWHNVLPFFGLNLFFIWSYYNICLLLDNNYKQKKNINEFGFSLWNYLNIDRSNSRKETNLLLFMLHPNCCAFISYSFLFSLFFSLFFQLQSNISEDQQIGDPKNSSLLLQKLLSD